MLGSKCLQLSFSDCSVCLHTEISMTHWRIQRNVVLLTIFFISSHMHKDYHFSSTPTVYLTIVCSYSCLKVLDSLLVSSGNLHHMVIVLAFESRNGSQIGLNLIRSQACTDNPINLSWFSKKGLANDTRGGGKPTTLTDVQITAIQWDAGENK